MCALAAVAFLGRVRENFLDPNGLKDLTAAFQPL
jgi:hypothetical protein